MKTYSHIVGFRKSDVEWNKMKKIWNNCIAADVIIPTKVITFFNHEDHNQHIYKYGLEVSIDIAICEKKIEKHNCLEINLSKVPKGIKIIRVYNT